MSGDGRFMPPPGYGGRQRRRILVVDDNVDAAEALALLLRHMGHDVQVAHDGRAALEAARLNHPQLVLLDLGMPGFDGYNVVARLRREDGFAALPFVAVTGSGELDTVRRTREAGFAAHLVKPVSLETLRAVLERF
jgi:two-component system, chemotaxis family, CheB/CheR fusion protein